jgi:integrating conjugative element membrane protein (TIGR03747 family)
MSDPAVAVQRQQVRQQGLIAGLVTLPFRFFGVLCGSLLLCIVIECIGMHFFWPEQGWRHAQGMLRLRAGSQVSENFTRSVLVQEPGRSAHRLIEQGLRLAVREERSAGLDTRRLDAGRAGATSQAKDFRYYIGLVYVHVESYLIAAAYTTLVFLVRLLVLTLTLPLFLMAAFVGLVDGLVRRDVRRFGAGRESGFVYHRARASLMPLAVLPWVTYLALPVSVHPLLILLPSAALLGVAVCIAAATFKKYL